MLDHSGAVLYVGKANNLKARLRSYTRLSDLSRKTLLLVEQVASIEVIKSKNPSAALILEKELVHSLQPKYNIQLKDDKSFPHICISTSHSTPRIFIHRGKQKSGDAYFGPFANPRRAQSLLQLLQRAFLLRSCTDSFFARTKQPCMLYQIKRCSAPCVNAVNQDSYRQLVDEAMQFLSGRIDTLHKELKRQMVAASKKMLYEQAAIYRDRLAALSIIDVDQAQEMSKFDHINVPDLSAFGCESSVSRIEIYDNSHGSGKNPVGAMVVFEDGVGFKRNDYRKFNIVSSSDGDDYQMMREVLKRRVGRINEMPMPDLMIIDGGLGHLRAVKDVLNHLGVIVPVISIAKGEDRNSGNEVVFVADETPVHLDRADQTKQFLQVLRDEAHRFAISSHRRRNEALMKSRT